MKLAFVEKKCPDFSRIAELLGNSARQSVWSNRGPVYGLMRDAFTDHMSLSSNLAIVPVSSGGVALEAIARLHAKWAGRKLRWIASAYTFRNLGRGYFSDVTFVDCDGYGRLDLNAVAALDPDSYDGFIATNPLGTVSDFSAYSDFAAKNDKAFLIDNASGMHTKVPDVKWQAFSLHHTKPYGMGEGGLALVPKEFEEELYALVNYGNDSKDQECAHWLGNGKLSDISAAFLLDRLERLPEWRPRSLEQRDRVIEIGRHFGLQPLHKLDRNMPLTSMPFLAPKPVSIEAVESTRHMTCAKYYLPLANLPQVNDIYAHLVNVPCHGDIEELSDEQIEADMRHCLEADTVGKLSRNLGLRVLDALAPSKGRSKSAKRPENTIEPVFPVSSAISQRH